MKIQSLSIVVPAKKCINNCKFCVSKMHISDYEDMITDKNIYYSLYKRDYMDRLAYARDNGCNTVMLTGDREPTQNRGFLKFFGDMNENLVKPFRNVELQTAGNLLTNDYLYFLRHHVGVNTISLSLNSFNDDVNTTIIGVESLMNIVQLCNSIKKYRFNLRLSLNMNKAFRINEHQDMSSDVDNVFEHCFHLGADQITFRKLYEDGSDSPEAQWVRDYRLSSIFWNVHLGRYITQHGKPLETLEFGYIKYSLKGIGVVVDTDCMNEEAKENYKYLILRENCKLYSKWDDKGSLIF